jgi:Fur family transcriptional regulator, ferric uptake regulator
LGRPLSADHSASRPDTAPKGRAAQGRSTRQKRALSELLDASNSFRSAQDLYGELRARGENVGLTTVYNQLRALAEDGQVDFVRSDDGETLYRRCGAEHHHHLVCRYCGRTVEVQGPEVERWADEQARANRFVDIQHTLEIVGTCHTCAASTGEKAALDD